MSGACRGSAPQVPPTPRRASLSLCGIPRVAGDLDGLNQQVQLDLGEAFARCGSQALDLAREGLLALLGLAEAVTFDLSSFSYASQSTSGVHWRGGLRLRLWALDRRL